MLTIRSDDKTTPDTIGVTGMMGYLGDLKVELEDIGMLAVSEIVQCPTMGEITREGFTDGWSSLK
jgi:DCN1-like protein 1/2